VRRLNGKLSVGTAWIAERSKPGNAESDAGLGAAATGGERRFLGCSCAVWRRGGAVNTNYTYTFKRGPKHYWLGLILAAIFGPLGLFYASKKGALLLLVLLFAVPYTLATLGGWHGAFLRHPLNVLGNDRVMDGMWRLCVLGSLVWCVFGVRRYNKQFKEVK